jgi:glycosyltransferase involved in cell wall biosynthesis
MLNECPVVASSASCIPEVCGDAAYYVDPSDADSIAEGIYQVATNETLRNDLIVRGLKRARMFSWTTSAERHMQLFRGHLTARATRQVSPKQSKDDFLPVRGGSA